MEASAANRYADPDLWYARPGVRDDPSRFRPEGLDDGGVEPGEAAVFFVHPTSFLQNSAWNAPLDDHRHLRPGAAVHPGAGERLHAGRPGVGAALSPGDLRRLPDPGARRHGRAGRGLSATWPPPFDAFLAAIPADQPIILAGHSQGSLHLTRLLQEKVAGTSLASRIVAVYAVGWPISLTADLPALGLPACAGLEDTGCVLSWASFAEPADERLVTMAYDTSTGLTGASRAGSAIVCTNPLTGTRDGSAPATANRGTLKADPDWVSAELIPDAVPARCAQRGFLLIGDPPELGNYVLPGNNYHVYDYSLFWMNTRLDARRRLDAWRAR